MRAARHKMYLDSLLCIYTHTGLIARQHYAAWHKVFLHVSVCACMCVVVARALWQQLPQSSTMMFLYVSVCAYKCMSVLTCV